MFTQPPHYTQYSPVNGLSTVAMLKLSFSFYRGLWFRCVITNNDDSGTGRARRSHTMYLSAFLAVLVPILVIMLLQSLSSSNTSIETDSTCPVLWLKSAPPLPPSSSHPRPSWSFPPPPISHITVYAFSFTQLGNTPYYSCKQQVHCTTMFGRRESLLKCMCEVYVGYIKWGRAWE